MTAEVCDRHWLAAVLQLLGISSDSYGPLAFSAITVFHFQHGVLRVKESDFKNIVKIAETSVVKVGVKAHAEQNGTKNVLPLPLGISWNLWDIPESQISVQC